MPTLGALPFGEQGIADTFEEILEQCQRQTLAGFTVGGRREGQGNRILAYKENR